MEETIRHLLDVASWEHNPIRFLIIDLQLVGGCDMSSAEAFVRVQRLLAIKGVILIFCGVVPEGTVANALQGVNLWADRGLDVEVFSNLNEAMECESFKRFSHFLVNSLVFRDRKCLPESLVLWPNCTKVGTC